MPESFDFSELIRRVRAGEDEATTSLSRRFESHVRRCARIQMRLNRIGDRVRTEVGTVDIFQSVLISLVYGLREGRFVLDHPDQLEKLLGAMVRLKLATIARKKVVTLRVGSEASAELDAGDLLIDPGPGPDRAAADRDLWEAVIQHFTEEELQLFIRRASGESWAEIAEGRGVGPDALRKKLERALDRVRDDFFQTELFED